MIQICVNRYEKYQFVILTGWGDDFKKTIFTNNSNCSKPVFTQRRRGASYHLQCNTKSQKNMTKKLKNVEKKLGNQNCRMSRLKTTRNPDKAEGKYVFDIE